LVAIGSESVIIVPPQRKDKSWQVAKGAGVMLFHVLMELAEVKLSAIKRYFWSAKILRALRVTKLASSGMRKINVTFAMGGGKKIVESLPTVKQHRKGKMLKAALRPLHKRYRP